MGLFKNDFCSVGTVLLVVNTGSTPTIAVGTLERPERHHEESGSCFPPKKNEVEIKDEVKVEIKEPVKVDLKDECLKVELKDEWVKIKGEIKEEEEFVCFTLTSPLSVDSFTFPIGSRFAVNVDYIIAIGPVITGLA